ncbi:ImmA/IrrE family metallo-endopeptidase [Brachybacterium sp. DNPG3]
MSRADADRSILDDVRLAYEQAGDVPATGDLPQTPAALRALLRPGFTECFAERLAEIDVDVIRLGELSTSHAVRDLGRAVILLPATGSWCEENRRLAHELGRLVLDASDGTSAAGAPSGDAACDEAARAFADELLISEEPIVRHTTAASARRFPAWLISAHLERIAAGDIRRGTLAWMLGVEAGTLDVDETPAPAPLSADELDALLA